MKKFLAVILALVMALSLVACSSDPAPAPANSGTESTAPVDGDSGSTEPETSGTQTVGIAMPTKSLERWNRDGDYLKAQFEAAGYNAQLKYSDNDSNQQNNDIQAMIADGVDVLIIAAIDGDTLSQTLVDAKSAGIPVIAYDRLIMNTDAVSYYVSFDNYTVGVLQGTFVIGIRYRFLILIHHLHDLMVCAAVAEAFQRADSRGYGRIGVCARA